MALGVPREEMEDERHVLPSVRLICESYVVVLQVEAVGAGLRLVAHRTLRAEDPRSSASSRSRCTIPWIPPEALDYFKSRLVQAPRDVKHGLSIVQQHCTTVETQRMAFEALAFKLEMLWAMIDTIYHAYRD